MGYLEKLKDPRWQRKRLEILQRDDFTCKLCNDDKETLNVHHVKYHGDPWEVDSSLLVTLCETCHIAIEHFKGTTIKKIVKGGTEEVKSLVIFSPDLIIICSIEEKEIGRSYNISQDIMEFIYAESQKYFNHG